MRHTLNQFRYWLADLILPVGAIVITDEEINLLVANVYLDGYKGGLK